MKPTSVLTDIQTKFLKLFSESGLTSQYYLTGGTALAGFYLPYRLSDDLDFFSENEVDLFAVTTFLKSIKNPLNFREMDINTSFNRNLVFLKFDNFVLKTEFTYFPFPQIERPELYLNVKIDSPIDIAANKLFTIYQKPRSRDFMDLYLLCQKKKVSLKDAIKKAKIKFDWHIDPIKLGSQFLLATELKDYPHLQINLKEKDWQNFFLDEAKKLKSEILSA
ncbi:hypothetical protein A3F39_02135 [Candidatus Berkelbacteria bacterium RIFCSPHIGHO2_12_FULL_50_11]|nr:MAG: hypothetical protein A3F39_02135 [Candidatus Berkelbacteria bacterium RIFCSPHIGHO2_12_FULL_50_11]